MSSLRDCELRVSTVLLMIAAVRPPLGAIDARLLLLLAVVDATFDTLPSYNPLGRLTLTPPSLWTRARHRHLSGWVSSP
jgi:hypothetical protein